jgi:hypothetical protein
LSLVLREGLEAKPATRIAEVLERMRTIVVTFAMWKVERAREAAWTNAGALWVIRRLPRLRAEFLETLDRLVGFAGRGLPRPLALR